MLMHLISATTLQRYGQRQNCLIRTVSGEAGGEECQNSVDPTTPLEECGFSSSASILPKVSRLLSGSKALMQMFPESSLNLGSQPFAVPLVGSQGFPSAKPCKFHRPSQTGPDCLRQVNGLRFAVMPGVFSVNREGK